MAERPDHGLTALTSAGRPPPTLVPMRPPTLSDPVTLPGVASSDRSVGGDWRPGCGLVGSQSSTPPTPAKPPTLPTSSRGLASPSPLQNVASPRIDTGVNVLACAVPPPPTLLPPLSTLLAVTPGGKCVASRASGLAGRCGGAANEKCGSSGLWVWGFAPLAADEIGSDARWAKRSWTPNPTWGQCGECVRSV